MIAFLDLTGKRLDRFDKSDEKFCFFVIMMKSFYFLKLIHSRGRVFVTSLEQPNTDKSNIAFILCISKEERK